MERRHVFAFHKTERLCSRRVTENLFAGGNKSVVSYPVRAVFMPLPCEAGTAPVEILISVSKRHFKRAVRRNRVKRQLREAYRRNRHILTDKMGEETGLRLAVAFLWLSDRLYTSAEVDTCIRHLLMRMAEHVISDPAEIPAHD